MPRRPLRSGLLVAVAGPALGAVPLVLIDTFGRAKPLPGHDSLEIIVYTAVLAGFVWGGAPALIAAGLVARTIAITNQISLRYWTYLTALSGVTAAITFFIFSTKRLFIVVFGPSQIFTFFLASAIFASVVLRILITQLGWQSGPPRRETANSFRPRA